MSHQLISRSFDLKRLRDEGYEVEVRTNYLLVHSVPYVNQQKQIAYGTLVSELTLGGETTVRPNTHVVLFAGGHPCSQDGVPIAQIAHASARQQLLPDLIVDHSFSNKPASGYVDYYEKMTRYIDIISAAAKALDAQADARTFKPMASSESDSVFRYIDTASSRAGIAAISERLSMFRIAIVGLGGTGSYVLDLVAKSAVREIHLFDDDLYLQHNAFRSPGATDLKDLERQILKVEYLRETYSRLRSGIVAHATRVTEVNVTELKAFNFVFVCVDKGPARKLILDALCAYGVAFVDVGMGVEVTDDQKLFAVCRTTSATIGRTSHLQSRVPTADIDAEGAYTQNIQIAELNALNAAFAVLKWKKIFGIYEDTEQEHHSTYSTNFHLLTGEETSA
jgi:ThiF family